MAINNSVNNTLSSGTGAISVGTDATAHTITIGNNVGATSAIVNCGTGALEIGANAIARTTTIGNTTGASVLALKCGTGDFTLASATGTVMTARDTGETSWPLQPTFGAYLNTPDNNVTGNGATYQLGTNTALTEVWDQGADFNTNGTFTAPVTGKYSFTCQFNMYNFTAATEMSIRLVTSNRTYVLSNENPTNAGVAGPSILRACPAIADLDAGDTAYTTIYMTGMAGDNADIYGEASMSSAFCGWLLG